MPKLNPEFSNPVNSAESDTRDFEPMKPGTYHFRLDDVVDQGVSAKGNPYWSWTFTCVEPPYVNRKQWNNTTFTDNEVNQKINKQSFDAFGVTADVDTDEILGQYCRLVIGVETQQEGANAGNLRNKVVRVLPAEEGWEPSDEADVTLRSKVSSIFGED